MSYCTYCVLYRHYGARWMGITVVRANGPPPLAPLAVCGAHASAAAALQAEGGPGAPEAGEGAGGAPLGGGSEDGAGRSTTSRPSVASVRSGERDGESDQSA